MKYIIVVPDGMADYPIDELNGKTPLEAARTPNMDFIARNGQIGRCRTIPQNLNPGSDVANLSLFGYDPLKYYSGRAPLEAANLKIELRDDEIVFRCNLVTIADGKMADYSAGHISTKEAGILIDFLNENLVDNKSEYKFYAGVSYRHLLVIKDKDFTLDKIKCIPPHDILNQDTNKFIPSGKNADILNALMAKSTELLAQQEINKVRIDLGENPANTIWLWGQGRKINLPPFKEKFGVSGCVISAVDLIKGIAILTGLQALDVPGATGYYDTNYAGKAEYALSSLEKNDFVYIHIEAPDEAGHNGDLRAKIGAIERLDELIVGKILSHFKNRQDYRILVVPDHATPLKVRTHTSDAVCFAMMGVNIPKGEFKCFSENEAEKSSVYFEKGSELIERFMKVK